MKFENCDIHDNILIDQTVVLPNGQVIRADNVTNVNDNDDDPSTSSGQVRRPDGVHKPSTINLQAVRLVASQRLRAL